MTASEDNISTRAARCRSSTVHRGLNEASGSEHRAAVCMTGTKFRDSAVLPDGSTNLTYFSQIITRSKKLIFLFGTLPVRSYITQRSLCPNLTLSSDKKNNTFEI